MWQRLVLGFILAIVAFFVVRFFSNDSFTNYDSVIETPAQGPMIQELAPRGSMSVSASGPNPPNVAANPRLPIIRTTEPEASDAFAESAEDANAPEHITHPERSFSPGIIPEQTAIAQSAGLAGQVAQSSQAFQQFSPEYIQNGGTFYGEVSAMEDENPNYSAF
jgi:hypothetical protein